MKEASFCKRLSFMALLIILAVAGVVPTFATDSVINETQKGSLTLFKYDYTAIQEDGVDVSDLNANANWQKSTEAEKRLSRYVIEGVQYSYIKAADIVQDKNSNVLKYKLNSKLADVLELPKKEFYTSEELNSKIDNIFRDPTKDEVDVKNKFEDFIKSEQLKNMPLTGKDGKTEAKDLGVGLYLIVETKVPANVFSTTNPFFVSIPTTSETGNNWLYDVTVYPKNATDIPTIDKQVRQKDDAALNNKPEYKDTTTVSSGDTAEYLTLSKLPKIHSKASYLTQYTFKDSADMGLKYNKDVKINFYDEKEDAYANNTAKSVLKLADTDFNVTYTETSTDNKMEVKLTQSGLDKINPKMSEKYMVVSYSMNVKNSSLIYGDKGNTNNVRLEWRRTAEGFYDKLHARARVYCYGLDITKKLTSENNKVDLSEVQFTLRNKTDGHYLTNTKGSDNIFYINDKNKATSKEEAGIFTVDKNGSLLIYGLEADTYELAEVKAPKGYQLLRKPIEITIKETKDEFTPTVTTHYDIEDIKNNTKNQSVEADMNSKVIELAGDRASAIVDNEKVVMTPLKASVEMTNALVPLTVVNHPNIKPPFTGDTLKFTALIGLSLIIVGVYFNRKKESEPGHAIK